MKIYSKVQEQRPNCGTPVPFQSLSTIQLWRRTWGRAVAFENALYCMKAERRHETQTSSVSGVVSYLYTPCDMSLDN